jgi:hypothetical protein
LILTDLATKDHNPDQDQSPDQDSNCSRNNSNHSHNNVNPEPTQDPATPSTTKEQEPEANQGQGSTEMSQTISTERWMFNNKQTSTSSKKVVRKFPEPQDLISLTLLMLLPPNQDHPLSLV